MAAYEDEVAGPSAAEGMDGSGSNLSRLLSLSDGVFAFALTLLAVTILLPQTFSGASLPPLLTYLSRLQPAFVGYILAFFIISAWWNSHHRLFSAIRRYDPWLVRLNSLFLLGISVTPFLVSLLFAYGPNGFGLSSLSSRLAVATYAGVQALTGCALLGLWHHASQGRRLVAASLPEDWMRFTEHRQLFYVLTFASSVGVAFASPLLAELMWIVVIFGFGHRLLNRPRGRRGPGSKVPPPTAAPPEPPR